VSSDQCTLHVYAPYKHQLEWSPCTLPGLGGSKSAVVDPPNLGHVYMLRAACATCSPVWWNTPSGASTSQKPTNSNALSTAGGTQPLAWRPLLLSDPLATSPNASADVSFQFLATNSNATPPPHERTRWR
jgi:hypothetical protein